MNIETEIIPGHRLRDFVFSETDTRRGIDNTPDSETIDRIVISARTILAPIEQRFGPMRITSWYRSPDLCAALGSSRTSNHTMGDTGDFEPVDHHTAKLLDIARFIVDEIPFRELIAEYWPQGWIHCCSRPASNIRVMKLKDKDHHYTRTTMRMLDEMYNF